MNNPLIQEVRAAREALAAKFDFDLHRIFEDAMKREAAEKISIARTSKRKTKSTKTRKIENVRK
jgi:hypothetical protein